MLDTIKVIEPNGLLDGQTGNILRQQVIDSIQNVDIVLLDMKNVNFMNSSGIGALVATLKVVRNQGKQLHICGLTDQARLIFELTKMDKVFKPYLDQADFQAKALNS